MGESDDSDISRLARFWKYSIMLSNSRSGKMGRLRVVNGRHVRRARLNAWPSANSEGGYSRVITADRLRFSVAHLHIHRPPLGAGLHTLRRVEAEDVLGAKLVLDVVVDARELRGLIDEVGVAAGLAAEAAEFESRIHLGHADADADRVNRN